MQTCVVILAFKLVLTPTVVVLATLAGRRFGRAVSGWLIGLPLTSGPAMVFFAVQHGRPFAARAATGSLGGAIAEVAFCAGYATAATRRAGWRVSVVAGSASFAAVALILEALPAGSHAAIVVPLAAVAAACLLVGIALVPRLPALPELSTRLPSRWDVPARALVATAFLLALTGLATTFGPRLSGLLAVYPFFTVVLAAFAHAHDGEAEAVQVLRGLLLGLFSFVAFYALLALLLTRVGISSAFAAALGAALVVQAASLVPVVWARPARDRTNWSWRSPR
ncbi:MAG TPA: hypothetical protein VMU73_10120 [Gaiellaceae bacterium]|nr:hypothetical protein [Gaiellaceae bacterium]